MQNYLIPGFDPTLITAIEGECGTAREISAADLLALVQKAKPVSNLVWIYRSATVPNIIADPIFAGFFWFNPVTKALKIYDGISWIGLPVPPGSLNGDVIIENTLPASALNIPVGAANKILQVNSTGDAWQFVLVQDAIPDGTLTLSKLVVGPNNTFLYSNGTINLWKSIDLTFILSILQPGSIPVNRLQAGTNTYVLTTTAGVPVWAALPPSSVPAITLGDAGKWLYTNGVISTWENLPVVTINANQINAGVNGEVIGTVGGVSTWVAVRTLFGRATSPLIPFRPTGVWGTVTDPHGIYTWTHGLGAVPTVVSVSIKCKLSYGSYVAGDIIPLTSLTTVDLNPGTMRGQFSYRGGGDVHKVMANATTVKIKIFYPFSVNALAWESLYTTSIGYGIDLVGSGANPLPTYWDLIITAQV